MRNLQRLVWGTASPVPRCARFGTYLPSTNYTVSFLLAQELRHSSTAMDPTTDIKHLAKTLLARVEREVHLMSYVSFTVKRIRA